MTSHLPAAAKANVLLTRVGSFFFAVPFLLSLLTPTAASADVYKWTDERGNAVISNVRPKQLDKVRNFEVAVEEVKATVVATPAEQMLLDKLDRLERQLVAQQYAQQSQAVPPASYYGSYNAPPPPPPGYYGSDYASYYPSLISYPYAFFPARTIVSRPRFAFGRSGVVHGGFVHRGRR